MKHDDGICPTCGGGVWLSKMKLCVEILKMIGYQKEKTRFSYDNFSKEELFAVYSYLKSLPRRKG